MDEKQDVASQSTEAIEESRPKSEVALPASSAGASWHGGLSRVLLFCTGILVVAIIGAGLLGGWMVGQSNGKVEGYTGIDSSRYQAIFLSNGQVYFGKLSDGGPELVKLQDIWYLQVQQGAQSADTLKNSESQVSLAKLGNELHGPDDSMSISKDQILFWENLKSDSKVVKAINDAK
jgi:hypothetical protein